MMIDPPIERVLDAEPVVSEGMISLLSVAARDCLCPVGLALNHALPPGASPRVVHHLRLTRRGRAALHDRILSEAASSALAALAAGPLTPATLARRAVGTARHGTGFGAAVPGAGVQHHQGFGGERIDHAAPHLARVADAGGSFAVDSSPGNGTVVRATFHLAEVG